MQKMRLNKLKLLILALFTSVTISYSELSINQSRVVDTVGEFNSIQMALSAYNSLKAGHLPLRVAEDTFCNLGYPIHQFYSPFAYILIAIFAIPNGNIYTGFALSVIFVILVALVYCYKIIMYLFRDCYYGVSCAYIYVMAPYTSVSRVMQGNYAEFMAICFLPMVLYNIIRLIGKFSIKYFTYSVLSLVLIYNTHLKMSIYFLSFLGFFFITHLICVIKRLIENKNAKEIIKYKNRLIQLFAVLIVSIGISSWSLMPIIMYEGLEAKRTNVFDTLREETKTINTLSMYSIGSDKYLFGDLNEGSKYQIGFLLNVIFLIYLINYKKIKSIYYIPILVTQLFIILIVTYQFNSSLLFIKIHKLIGFPFQIVVFYQLLGLIISEMSLKLINETVKQKYKIDIKSYTSIFIIIISIIICSKYQSFGNELQPIRTVMSVEKFKNYNFFDNELNKEFLLVKNRETVPLTDKLFLIQKEENSYSKSQEFIVNIDEYSRIEGYNNFIDLNTLYYPGLQKIEVRNNNDIIEDLDYGFHRSNISVIFKNNDVELLDINCLRINNLPSTGILKVIIVFEGYWWANLITKSLILLLTIINIVAFVVNKGFFNPQFLRPRKPQIVECGS
jgi:hypothetical protein